MISLGEHVSNCNALISDLSAELEDDNLVEALEYAKELVSQARTVVTRIEEKIEYRERESDND